MKETNNDKRAKMFAMLNERTRQEEKESKQNFEAFLRQRAQKHKEKAIER